MTASAVIVGETNKPRRPPSHAKQHFTKCNSRWKCNYCDMSYGCNTATSNFWKHLSSKHPNKLNKNDERQRSSTGRWRHGAKLATRRRVRDQGTVEVPPFAAHQGHKHVGGNVAFEQMQMAQFLPGHPALRCPEELTTIAATASETATAIFHVPPANPPMSPANNMAATTPFSLLPNMEQQLRFREIGMEQIVFDIIRNSPRFAELFHNRQIQALFRRATPTFVVDNIDEIEHEVLRIQRDKMAAALSRYIGGYYLYLEPIHLWRHGVRHLAVLLAHEKLDDSGEVSSDGSADDTAHGREMESLLRYKRNQSHLLALVELRPEVSVHERVEEVALTLELFRVASKLLGIVVGKFDGGGEFATALHNRLRHYGAYSCKTYATRESIGTDLESNLGVYRETSTQIKEKLLTCLHYLNQIEQTQKMADSSFSWQQEEFEPDVRSSRGSRGSPSMDDSFKKLSWDLMPILPHTGHIKRYLTESRALGLDYSYNCGTQWPQLQATLEGLARDLRCVTCQQMALRTRDDGGASVGRRIELLRKLSKKMEAFPASCAAAVTFLSVTKLTSPFTRKIAKAVEKLPKGLPEETQKNILFLKMWTKFKFDDS